MKDRAYEIPPYLRLTPVSLSDDEKYSYERYDCFHKIQYLPEEIKNMEFIPSFQKNKYESQLQAIYEELKKIGRTSDLKKLYRK